MRTILALGALLTGSIVGVGGFAAPASAEVCSVPRLEGFTFTSLHAHGIACHEAQHLAVRTLRAGAPAGWSCTHRISGRHVAYSCHAASGSGHSYSFGYHVH